MARALSIQEKQISDSDRETYLAAIPERAAAAVAVQSHFWVFEHATERGRFVEFHETPDAESLGRLLGSDSVPEHWCEVRGG